MATNQQFLLEIGTEELPAALVGELVEAIGKRLADGLKAAHLDYSAVTPFATPRRLAWRFDGVPQETAPVESERRGPSEAVALDGSGGYTKALLAFARSCGVDPEQLELVDTGKGRWFYHRRIEPARPVIDLLDQVINQALGGLPLKSRMHWDQADCLFVRPIRWIVALFGDRLVPGRFCSIDYGRLSRGHRFNSDPSGIGIETAARYEEQMAEAGVVASAERRLGQIRELIAACEEREGVRIDAVPELLAEVNQLVEAATPLIGRFDRHYLTLPEQVIRSVLIKHQKFFPVYDSSGAIAPLFLTIANIDSLDHEQMKSGYQRVLKPRLDDALFFWNQDNRTPIRDRVARLREISFHEKIGSLHDRIAHMQAVARTLLPAFEGVTEESVTLAVELAKADLTTDMVFEFPELEGVAGGFYARHQGYDPAVCEAVADHYRPRFSGDRVPKAPLSIILALSDKIDYLASIFATGYRFSSDKDPYAIRRAGLGVVRILHENDLAIAIRPLIEAAVAAVVVGQAEQEVLCDYIERFLEERFQHHLTESGVARWQVAAVGGARRPAQDYHDFRCRLQLIDTIAATPDMARLVQANKRVWNMIKNRKSIGELTMEDLPPGLHSELSSAIGALRQSIDREWPVMGYQQLLVEAAALAPLIDRFFDEVQIVAADDERRTALNLALLAALHGAINVVCDLSQFADQ